MTYILEMDKVSKSYGAKEALRKVNLKISKGRLQALLGLNGSGKTTALRLMAGLEAPSEGRVLLKGVEARPEDLRKEVSMAFQKPVFFNTTVYKNVAYGLEARKLPEGEVKLRVKEALRRVGLGGYEDRKPKTLSGGEQQRVSIARVLVLDVPILLFDEPTSNLDPLSEVLVERAIVETVEEGGTVVIASPNLNRLVSLADEVALIVEGSVVYEGHPQKLKTFLEAEGPNLYPSYTSFR